MKLIRWLLAKLILFYDRTFPPVPIQREPSRQAELEKSSGNLSLYQFEACPFCVKVRRAAKRLRIPLKIYDAKNDSAAADELAREGGKLQVPCLKITSENGQSTWMYESSDIVAYLNRRFS